MPILATNLLLENWDRRWGKWSFGVRPRGHTNAEIA